MVDQGTRHSRERTVRRILRLPCLRRYVIAILLVVYGPNEGPRARVMFEQLLEDGRENAGVSEYRAHIDYMDEVRSHFNFNNGALNRLVDTIKNTLDPNGILSQGKSGIWTYLKKPNL